MIKAKIFFATAALLVTFAAVFAAHRARITGSIYYFGFASFVYYGFYSDLPCETGNSGCVNAQGYQLYVFTPPMTYTKLQRN